MSGKNTSGTIPARGERRVVLYSIVIESYFVESLIRLAVVVRRIIVWSLYLIIDCVQCMV